MPRLVYERKRFGEESLMVIAEANQVLDLFGRRGFDLTLRQLYYQFVARDLFPDDRTWRNVGGNRWVRDPEGTKNAEPNYKWLGGIVNDARMAGYIDWENIVDRTRSLRSIGHWTDPADIIEATVNNYRHDLWASQGNYVEVWIEKDALVGVIEGICTELDIPYFSCRGYTSQSEMWGASQRLLQKILGGKRVTILHLGDHDPSGIDMTRDIRERLTTFIATDYLRHKAKETGVKASELSQDELINLMGEVMKEFEVLRIALTMDQVEEYDPPPNPAKLSDTRAKSYVENYGNESWELDALDPDVLADLIRDNAETLIEDTDAWEEALGEQKEGQTLLRKASDRWPELVETLNGDESNG